MRIMLCIAAVASLGAAPALAQEPAKAANAPAHGKEAVVQASAAEKTAREVYICDSSAETRRGFAREFGSAEFVTAEEAASAEAWAAPRCMTPAEARKLKQLASAR
jgi:predicted dehydrogenase